MVFAFDTTFNYFHNWSCLGFVILKNIQHKVLALINFRKLLLLGNTEEFIFNRLFSFDSHREIAIAFFK